MANSFTTQGATPNMSMAPKTPNMSMAPKTPNMSMAVQPSANSSSYTGGSVVDYLNSQGKSSDYGSRTNLAKQYGISNYTGTADQNMQLLNYLRGNSGTQNQSSPKIPQIGSNPGLFANYSTSTPTTSVTNTSVPTTGTSSTPTTSSGQDTTYAGLIKQLATQAQMTPEEIALKQKLADLKTKQATAVGNEQMTPGTNSYQTGRIGIINQVANAEQGNTAQQIENLATQRQVASDALAKAAGLAAPQLASYSQQAFNPQTGQFSGGGSLQEAVSNVAQKLQSGQMTYSDAVSALSGYGQGGLNALQQALPQGFNIAQSNTLGSQQGSIGPAYSFASKALDNLNKMVMNLGFAQGSNIPIINSFGNALSYLTGHGSEQSRAYIQAVQEARAAYSQLLAVGGATPSAADARANAAIPDNATPNDIRAAIASLQALGGAKVGIYGNPGASNTSSSSSNYSGLRNGGAF